MNVVDYEELEEVARYRARNSNCELLQKQLDNFTNEINKIKTDLPSLIRQIASVKATEGFSIPKVTELQRKQAILENKYSRLNNNIYINEAALLMKGCELKRPTISEQAGMEVREAIIQRERRVEEKKQKYLFPHYYRSPTGEEKMIQEINYQKSIAKELSLTQLEDYLRISGFETHNKSRETLEGNFVALRGRQTPEEKEKIEKLARF